jgi:hypothetical protein
MSSPNPFQSVNAGESARARADVERQWENLGANSPEDRIRLWTEKRSEHLVPTLTYLRGPRKSTDDPGESERRYLSGERERVLLLMAGYSPEQLALSIALHVKEFGCTKVIPVSSSDAWLGVQEEAPSTPGRHVLAPGAGRSLRGLQVCSLRPRPFARKRAQGRAEGTVSDLF